MYSKTSSSDNYLVSIKSTVKPLYSGHHRDLEKVSAMNGCPLYRSLTFFLKRKTYETPKPNMYIKFRLIGQNEWMKARVLSKQPKRTGKNKDWFNILQEEMKSLAVWIGSKSGIGKRLYVQNVCC